VSGRWDSFFESRGEVMQTVTDITEMMEQLISNKKGYRISVDGSIIEQPFDGESYDIKKIKNECNFDYIELVPLPNDIIMIADEEGLLRSKPYNMIASVLYQEAYKNRSLGIVGDVIICHTSRVD
jgi:hypothetical protein